jgi:hypothetical protein
VPVRENLESKPERLKYQANGIRYRHYGKHIENIIRKVIELEDGPKKDELIKLVGNQMKKLYLNWNRESVTDEVIAGNLAELSGGKLILGEGVELAKTHDILQKQSLPTNGTRQKKHNLRQGQMPYKSHGYQPQQGSYYRSKRNKRSQ